MVIENKKGWTSIIEVFVSILLLAGVLAVIVSSEIIPENKGEQIYKEQSTILKVIQLEDNFRGFVLNDNVDEINNIVKNRQPDYLECEAVICDTGSPCELSTEVEEEIFAKSILITSNLIKELKLFCWEK